VHAVVIQAFGGPEVLEVVEVADPEPGHGQVRVAIVAAGTNPVDAFNRMDGSWAGLRLPCVLGYDIAGVVDQVGPGAPADLLGQRVFAMTHFPDGQGGYAEYAIIDADLVAVVPEHTSLVEAAAVPLAAGTAYDMLERLGLAAGSSLLVTAASGGVGTFLVQLAVSRGIRVFAVGGPRSHRRLRDLGAEGCIDYTQGSVADAAIRLNEGPVDALADAAGGDVAVDAIRAVRHRGQVAGIATPLFLDMSAVIDPNLTFHGVLITDSGPRILALAQALASGIIEPVIAAVLPLEQVADAHVRLESGHSGGKIVLEVREGDVL
jgi:NADPH:quinone reductase